MRELAVLGIVALLAGCGTDDGDANSHEQNHANHANHAANNASPKIDVYADGLMKMGENGSFHIMLMGATPSPPDVGDNTWTLRITDIDDNPIDGAKVTVEPFMPAHGHGTSPTDYSGTFTEDGTYEVGPFDLFMPGVWETTITVEGESEDAAMFAFELEG